MDFGYSALLIVARGIGRVIDGDGSDGLRGQFVLTRSPLVTIARAETLPSGW